MSLETGPITIKSGERLCQPMCDILILTSAFAYSTLALRTGAIPPHNPKLGFRLPCAQIPVTIKLPVFGPLEGMLKNEVVTDMTFQIEDSSGLDGGEDNVPAYEVGNTLLNIISPIFSSYYERQAEWLKNNLDGDPSHWPMLFQFARTVRNAVVHLGVITINNPNRPPVSWEGLSYSPSDNGKEIHSGDLNTGDFIALMIEIDRKMNGLGAPPL